jgi:putative transposase
MSRKKTTYSTEFKTKLVLELLKGEKTIQQIAIDNNVFVKNLQNWKAIFLANAEFAMEPSKAVKEYKDENAELKAKIDEYAKVVGKITVERDWLEGKLKSLSLSKKQKSEAYDLIYTQTKEWLKVPQNVELVKWIIDQDSQLYRAVTNEVLALFNWLKRFAYWLLERRKDKTKFLYITSSHV